MKVLIYSPAFPPQIGGLEEIARICATGLAKMGHDVTVLCETAAGDAAPFPLRVLRSPSWREACQATKGCDVFLMFNMSLKGLPLPLLFRKPLVISHQGWYGISPEDLNLRARVKRWLSRRLAANIACSRAVAEYLGGRVEVVPNGYDDDLFRCRPEIPRQRDVLFVGRLVSDKGANLLVTAMSMLSQKGMRPTLTITGAGPEEQSLKAQVAGLGLEKQTIFTGPLRGEDLAKVMNAHRVQVVPSLWEEPFGIVALEGIASGCRVIGSRRGGLGEAIGNCGLVFENGNAEELAQALMTAFADSPGDFTSSAAVRTHLNRHQKDSVVRAYEQLLFQAHGNFSPLKK